MNITTIASSPAWKDVEKNITLANGHIEEALNLFPIVIFYYSQNLAFPAL